MILTGRESLQWDACSTIQQMNKSEHAYIFKMMGYINSVYMHLFTSLQFYLYWRIHVWNIDRVHHVCYQWSASSKGK